MSMASERSLIAMCRSNRKAAARPNINPVDETIKRINHALAEK
jgi:hypothetical protein